eukprot:CAMPEP_0174373786 /NCGR_PEP_ID=MMETSP0811_2-20130205/108491_1 /TAXON_ID=73025 ORGANISM="Eutreptiella gymnastica-like, Strain CCMP1594" /NCGR_SAMPLE_ID=MMETSP0811_2 /ASSEMBLY_ACC=CAM_ASM_000667 /LENGTH=393 /DNA_ID=CAMNT_0015522497 /DNA_START=307 /DNA_END=1488 /DNA_ORIENTATION=+
MKSNSALAACLPDTVGVYDTVQELDLSRNFVGQHGLLPLLECVYVNPRLETLVLAGNGLHNDVIPVLCRIAAVHPALAVLDLSDNPRLSTAAGQLLLRVAQTNRRIRRLVLRNTLVPNDVIARIDRCCASNLQAFQQTGLECSRVVRFEALFFDILPPEHRAKLHQVLRLQRLATYLHAEDTFQVSQKPNDPFLPQLSSNEVTLFTEAWQIFDTEVMGLLNLGTIFQIFASHFEEVYLRPDQPDFLLLCERMDLDSDGHINFDQFLLLSRNYLHIEAVKIKNEIVQVLRGAFVTFTEGKDHVPAAQLAALTAFCDQRQRHPLGPSDAERVAQYATAASTRASAPAHPTEAVDEDTFVQAYMLHHCLTNPYLHYAVIGRKKWLKGLVAEAQSAG